jgi:excisionase family DNA binding protein
MSQNDIERSLTPEEAAKFLGISVGKLARIRREGRVQGTRIGNSNLYIYSIGDLRKADLSQKRRGPKPKKASTDIVQN